MVAASPSATALHMLRATPATCFWGFFDNSLPPVLRVRSGDFVSVETLTHQAGDAPELCTTPFLFFLGDPHMAEGDGELSGTAIETSANGLVQLIVRKDFPVTAPLLETATHWFVHGYHEDLNQAMKMAARRLLDFVVDRLGCSRDDAYSLLSVAADFGITQVVDQRQGVHGAIPKHVLTRT
jgi:acetamidase/formamidase